MFTFQKVVSTDICKSTTEVASPLPEAIEFEKWVFDELLPILRRTGTYTIDDGNVSAIMKSFRETLQQWMCYINFYSLLPIKI
jgi:prophage antirepressor-like protein